MERVVLKKEITFKALNQLEHMIKKLEYARNNLKETDEDIIAYRDSVIKRFEFCFDLFWKLYKEILFESYGIEVASPKKVFQECLNQNIFSQDILNLLLIMCDERNATVHIYDEHIAEQISFRIPLYYQSMFDAINNLK